MKDFIGEAVPRVSAETAIELVNRMQMQTRAWRRIFEVDQFPLADQLATEVVAAQSFTQEGSAGTTDTKKALSFMMEFTPGQSERTLRGLQNRILRQDKNEDNHKVYHWRLKNLDTAQKLNALADLFGDIEDVIRAQKADPENPDAGRKLIPEDVYFNIVANHVRYQKGKEV